MDHTYWQKQSSDKPLFPDLIWSKPQRKSSAGKLLIIGGNLHAFAAPAEAYAEALRSGIGSTRVVLPDAAKKIVGPILESVDYAPSNPSGSFSQKSLSELLDHADWSDGVLVAGDLGKNSETAILLEKFITKYSGKITLTNDALDYSVDFEEKIMLRDNTLLVASFNQLQKLAVKFKLKKPFLFDMNLMRFIELLHNFSEQIYAAIIVSHSGHIFCASGGKIVSLKISNNDTWRVKTATRSAVWWLQNPSKSLEAYSTAIYEINKI